MTIKRTSKILLLALAALLILIALLLLFLFACKQKAAPPKTDNIPTETPTHEASELPSGIESDAPTLEETLAKEEESEQDQEKASASVLISESKITYTVTLLDQENAPILQKITVKLLKDGAVVAEESTVDGVATFLVAPDIYTVEVVLAKDSEYYYDSKTPFMLAEQMTAVSIPLYNRLSDLSKTVVYAYSTKTKGFTDCQAYSIKEGANSVSVPANDRAYFLFTPEKDGKYEILLDTQNALLLGYFGNDAFAQKDSIAEDMIDNAFTLNVKPSNLGITYLIGITSNEEIQFTASLSIRRIGDASLDISDFEPIEVTAEHLPNTDFHEKITESAVIADLDINDTALTVVFNPSDGFYHLGTESGPTVYMRLASKSAYLDSFNTMAQRTGLSYVFCDDTGNFTHKEQYNSLFLAYASIADRRYGLVPLTEELANAVKKTGESMEWWKFSSPNYIFGEDPVPEETAWLFACCSVTP